MLFCSVMTEQGQKLAIESSGDILSHIFLFALILLISKEFYGREVWNEWINDNTFMLYYIFLYYKTTLQCS